MRNMKIVTDSSANLLEMADIPFSFAPLKVIAAEREFIDSAELDVPGMLSYMEAYKGRSQTSCPNAADWLAAFGDADDILCVTITSALSGSYNAALSAARIYESEHEGARVFVLDSLSTGPEMQLMLEKARDMMLAGTDFDSVCAAITAYRESTELVFMLKSLHNFAANGRVSPSVAKLAGILGLCVVGRASDEGTLEPTDKCRGEARSLARLVEHMKAAGLTYGRVHIAHCRNEAGAAALRALLSKELPHAEVSISELRGLCSYYAESGGLLVGFEKH